MLIVLYFIYGLIFFALWLSVTIYPKKNSSFKLADRLWLLAAFGLVHGAKEWVDLFMLVYTPAVTSFLKVVSLVLLSVSFYFLLEFGVRLIVETQERYHRLKVIPPVLVGLWVIGVVYVRDITAGDILARYLLGLSGALITSIAMILKISKVEKMGMQVITRYLKLTAGVFVFYGFFSGMIVPDMDIFPASVLNYSFFINKVGLPVQFFRAVCGLLITYGVIRILHVFDLETKDALRRSQERYKNLFNSSRDSIFRVNAEGIFTMMNQAGARIFGFERAEEIIGRDALEFWREPKDRDAYRAELVLKKSVSSYPIQARKRDGEPIDLESSSTVSEDEKGNIVSIEGIMRDVTERNRIQEEMQSLAVIDELTGLNNRRGFLVLATQQIKIVERLKHGAVLIFADIDKMKFINDTFGHAEGDRALTDLANILRRTLRTSDIISRWGGDEFVALTLPSEEEAAEALMIRLQASLDAHNSAGNRPYTLSVSFGLVRYDPENPSAIEELLVRGDRLMYEQKNRGGKPGSNY